MVRDFRIEGATLIPIEELKTVVAAYTGKPLTLPELMQAAEAVSAHYRKRGYYARVFLPEQDVTEGVITLRVVEGHLGEVKLDDTAKRADGAYVQKVATRGLERGEPYSATILERNLLIANDLPGIRTNGILSAGKGIGESDLTIRLDDAPFLAGQAGIHNFGSKSTGVWQGNASTSLNNLSGKGDQATLRAVESTHLTYGNLGYSTPLGYTGLRAGLWASYLTYKLGEQFSALEAEGNAYTIAAHVQYPFIRTAQHSLWGDVSYENRHYKDDVFGIASQRKNIHAAVASINGDFSDTDVSAINRYSVALTVGTLNLSDVTSSWAADQSGPRTNGNYAKLYADFVRDRHVVNGVVLRTAVSGQLAGKNLDSSEKFALGGPNGVRAYPVNEALGDSGALLSAELHKTIARFDVYGFIDIGMISQYNSVWTGWNSGSNAPNSYWLGGVGLGASYPLLDTYNISSMIATPIGTNKGAPETERNQDGSHRATRIWVGLTQLF